MILYESKSEQQLLSTAFTIHNRGRPTFVIEELRHIGPRVQVSFDYTKA